MSRRNTALALLLMTVSLVVLGYCLSRPQIDPLLVGRWVQTVPGSPGRQYTFHSDGGADVVFHDGSESKTNQVSWRVRQGQNGDVLELQWRSSAQPPTLIQRLEQPFDHDPQIVRNERYKYECGPTQLVLQGPNNTTPYPTILFTRRTMEPETRATI
jgi:hypothetical protein